MTFTDHIEATRRAAEMVAEGVTAKYMGLWDGLYVVEYQANERLPEHTMPATHEPEPEMQYINRRESDVALWPTFAPITSPGWVQIGCRPCTAGYHSEGENGRVDLPLAWAAFTYSGLRNFEHVQVTSIAEQAGSPLQGSLSFFNSANTHALAQWIANQQFKRLKALDGGLADRARAIEESIRRIEDAIRDVVGVDFRFHTTGDDLNVRGEMNGAFVDFGLLPEGVKSIVSWIADLLMRMDRTPWKDNLPVHEREFLLLLDELDVHLHPAWQRKLLPVVQRSRRSCSSNSISSPVLNGLQAHDPIHQRKPAADPRVFGLQRSVLCIERRRAIMSIRAAGDPSNPYRFLG